MKSIKIIISEKIQQLFSEHKHYGLELYLPKPSSMDSRESL